MLLGQVCFRSVFVEILAGSNRLEKSAALCSHEEGERGKFAARYPPGLVVWVQAVAPAPMQILISAFFMVA